MIRLYNIDIEPVKQCYHLGSKIMQKIYIKAALAVHIGSYTLQATVVEITSKKV